MLSLLKELELSLKKRKYIGKRIHPNEKNIILKSLANKHLFQTVIKGIPQRNPQSLINCLNYFEKEKEPDKLLDELKANNSCIFSPTGEPKKFSQLTDDIKKWKKSQLFAKKGEVLQTHFIFSTVEKPTEKNAQKLASIMKKVQDTFRLNGQSSLFAIHTDKENLHAHILVNKFNARGEKKYIKKPFLMAIKEEYKNDLNIAFGEKYTILSKKYTIEKTPDKEIKYLKKIENFFGEEGIEYEQYLNYKVNNPNEKKQKFYKKKQKILKNAIYTKNETLINIIKNDMEKYSSLRKKGMLKKKLKQLLPNERNQDNIIDFLYFRREKLLKEEKNFGARNFQELNKIENFFTDINEGKNIINDYNYLQKKIINYKKIKKAPINYEKNLLYLEDKLIEKKLFRKKETNLITLENKIKVFFEKNADYNLIKNLKIKNNKSLAIVYAINKIEDPLVAKFLLKNAINYTSKKKIETKKINF